MKLSKLFVGFAALGLVAGFTPSAQASPVLDAWQMEIDGNLYTNIGRLSLTSGSSTVTQELTGPVVNGNPTLAVGDRFTESGILLTISYVQNNVVGPLDSGSTTILF
jgi:hypothetical protein